MRSYWKSLTVVTLVALAGLLSIPTLAGAASTAQSAPIATPAPRTATNLYNLIEKNPTQIDRLQFHTGANNYVVVYMKGVAQTSDVSFGDAQQNRQMQDFAQAHHILITTQNVNTYLSGFWDWFCLIVMCILAVVIFPIAIHHKGIWYRDHSGKEG